MQRKGICKNIGICNNANTHKVIVINDDNEPFVCPECNEPLEAVSDEVVNDSSSNNKTKLFVIVGVFAAILVGLIIWLTVSSGGSSNDPEASVTDSIANDSITEEIVATNVDSIAQAKADSIIAAKAITDSIRAKEIADSIKLAQADSIIAASKAPKSNSKAASNRGSSQSAPQASTGKLHLSYGSYSGQVKGGLPHGSGTLTYSTSRQIDSRDPKGRVAQPGEYIVGEWDNGHLIQGRWFKNDGTKEAVIIGKAG